MSANGPRAPRATLDEDALKSYRPSLLKLTKDADALISGGQDLPGTVGYTGDLINGFDSKEDIVWWLQATCIRTLGQVTLDFLNGVADQLIQSGRPDEPNRALVACLLDDETRTDGEIGSTEAERTRLVLGVEDILPAYHHAFRHLRKDATEYIDEVGGESNEHGALKQRFIAMRPAIDEMDAWQTRVLARLIDGFEDDRAIMEWLQWLELATHGEVRPDFGRRCIRERSARDVLTGDTPRDYRTRLTVFGAGYVVPMFCRGAREMAGKAGELPSGDSPDKEVEGWE